MISKTLLFSIAFLTIISSYAQDSSNKVDYGTFALKGHLQYLENVWNQPNTEKMGTMGSINNRLDFEWFKSGFEANIGMRNFINYGQMVYDYYPYLADQTKQDFGFMNLTKQWFSDSSYFFTSTIDRANLSITHKNLEVIAGRQRINWGTNLVWNPNDIFNTFNYFDFDYVERPGCDALKVQYYTGMASSAQLAWKIDADNKHTIAAMYKFNKWNYDFQFLGGKMPDDIVLGAGWSGQINGAGFNGEASWFIPTEIPKGSDHYSVLVASAGANYTFPNSLYIHASAIYNSDGTSRKAIVGNFLDRDINAKTLTPSRMEIFGEVAYQISPLIRGTLAGIINPFDGSAFVGPSLDISISDNVGLFLIGQLFAGDEFTEYGSYGQLLYGRLKYSF
ncbi:MAG: hypothetical protein K9H16_15650 [Bacteroidales bacterium]|nr:hypothetical protein [Bacteroidales bacterium]